MEDSTFTKAVKRITKPEIPELEVYQMVCNIVIAMVGFIGLAVVGKSFTFMFLSVLIWRSIISVRLNKLRLKEWRSHWEWKYKNNRARIEEIDRRFGDIER
jgi:hypothetical protein